MTHGGRLRACNSRSITAGGGTCHLTSSFADSVVAELPPRQIRQFPFGLAGNHKTKNESLKKKYC